MTEWKGLRGGSGMDWEWVIFRHFSDICRVFRHFQTLSDIFQTFFRHFQTFSDIFPDIFQTFSGITSKAENTCFTVVWAIFRHYVWKNVWKRSEKCLKMAENVWKCLSFGGGAWLKMSENCLEKTIFFGKVSAKCLENVWRSLETTTQTLFTLGPFLSLILCPSLASSPLFALSLSLYCSLTLSLSLYCSLILSLSLSLYCSLILSLSLSLSLSPSFSSSLFFPCCCSCCPSIGVYTSKYGN